ncbi:MAG: hypothetical protein ACKVVT_02975 [Dehalococcoidia bacterium]
MARAARRRGPQDEGRSPAANAGRAADSRVQAAVQLQAAAGNRAAARVFGSGQAGAVHRLAAKDVEDLAKGAGPAKDALDLAEVAKQLGELAREDAKEHAGFGEVHGPADALGTCLWAALLAEHLLREGGAEGGAVGPQVVATLTANEELARRGDGTPAAAMARANLATGMRLAEALWAGGKRGTTELVAAATALLDEGGLVMLDEAGTFVSTEDWEKRPVGTWEPGRYLEATGEPRTPPPDAP